jgi:conjugal transfer ATP-binding protein TraC
MGCEGLKEEIIGASLFLSCLPLCFDHSFERFVKRTRRMISGNLADMLPLYGSVKGTQSPAQVYLNRRGEPVFWDFFDSNTNPHAIIVGASGAGKSFFVNDFILQNARLDSHFFVLDKGDSYRKLCQILGGQYIRFELNNPVTINPFLKEPDPEHMSFLVTVLSEMCSGGDDRERLFREQESVLQKAVAASYKERKNPDEEVTLSDVVEKLKSHACNRGLGTGENIGITLALKLRAFTREGQFGKFFDGKNQFSLGSRFTVFELGNLSAHSDLQLVVLLNIMYFITNFVSSAEMKPKRKFLLIDEAWSLLRLKNTAEFITNSFKTYRKYRCSAVAITQEIADLVGAASGIAIQANAANKVFLKQEPNVVDSLKTFASLTDKEIELLKSVETQKGKFSEALVISDTSRGVIRLVPDPFLYWIATSDAKDNEFLENKVRELEGKYLEALETCAKEKPYGLH